MTAVVVAADWLDEHRDDPDVQIVDVRDAWEFEGIGHVPGAVNLPFDSFRAAEGDAGMLPGVEVFADLLGEAGISTEDEIVAYDDTHGVFAARFLVTAALYGHDFEKLHLLDGDFSAWSRAHETSQDPAEIETTTYEIDRPDPADTPLVERDTVRETMERVREGEEGVVLVDTREAREFAEGHVPGAIQLDWRAFVDDENRGLKSTAEIESILEDHGLTPETRVVLYCNTARRISHTYLVLRHLGYDDLAFYEGSLTEWKEAGEPIEEE